jgi:hypothetical protein
VSAPIPTLDPARIVAGDTAKWLRSLPDYPASAGWSLVYTLVNAAQRVTFSSSASGDDHLVTVSAATTAAWVAGDYTWRAQATKAGEVYTVGGGQVTIEPAFGAAVDARSTARQSLDAVEAMLQGRAASGVAEYQIAGRQLRHIPIPELLQLRDRLRADVAAEAAAQAIAAGLAPRGRIAVRFSR